MMIKKILQFSPYIPHTTGYRDFLQITPYLKRTQNGIINGIFFTSNTWILKTTHCYVIPTMRFNDRPDFKTPPRYTENITIWFESWIIQVYAHIEIVCDRWYWAYGMSVCHFLFNPTADEEGLGLSVCVSIFFYHSIVQMAF